MSERLSLPSADIDLYVNGNKSFGKVLSVSQSCGARSMDSAVIQVPITEVNQNATLLLEVQDVRIVVRSTRNAVGGVVVDNERLIFWGKTCGFKPNINDSESLIFEARTMPCLFGFQLIDMREVRVDGEDQSRHRIIGDLVFNPIVNGVARGNSTIERHSLDQQQTYFFVDPRRAFSAASRKAAGGQEDAEDDAIGQFSTDHFWTLKSAVDYLCQHANPGPSHYENPSADDLQVLDGPDGAGIVLRNEIVKFGTYLPEALDGLLNPYGYGWCVQYIAPETKKIKIFRRGVGTERAVCLQSPDEYVNPAKSNMEGLSLGVGYQSLVNAVGLIGDFVRYEYTWELNKAWSAEYDETDIDELAIGSETYEANSFLHRVWRDWVLNEAGDYTGVRDGLDEPYAFPEFESDEIQDDGGLHLDPTPRRRRFLPCLTLDEGGTPVGRGGYVVEWYDTDLDDWSVIDATFDVLRDECGIRFSGTHIPEDIYYAAAGAKVRITCSVMDDRRLVGYAGRQQGSFQPETVAASIDVSDEFKLRRILPGSKFNESESVVAVVDDIKKIHERAEQIRNAWDQADVSGSIVIPYIDDSEYQLGDVVTRIDGRNLNFSIGSSSELKYPQIVGITFDCQRQKQTLHIESFRDPRYT